MRGFVLCCRCECCRYECSIPSIHFDFVMLGGENSSKRGTGPQRASLILYWIRISKLLNFACAVMRTAMAPLSGRGLGDLCQCARSAPYRRFDVNAFRAFSTTPAARQADLATTTSPTEVPPPPLDPNLVITRSQERQLLRTGVSPIGSRRRRAALQGSRNIPFEQLPYQCFQEARALLQEDREEKIAQIEMQRARIERLKARSVEGPAAEDFRQKQLGSMRKHLEYLKVQADINDPLVKKRFEDGESTHFVAALRQVAHD